MPPTPENAEIQQRGSGNERGVGLEVWVKSPTWEVAVGAVLQDFTPGEVILLLDDPIESKTHVSVRANTCSFHGDILYCKPSGIRWEAHVSFDDVDSSGLRRSPRFPVRIPARVFANGSGGPIEAMILDISGEGLGVEMGHGVQAQASVAVQSEDAVALGHVRHCREIGPGVFRAGILMQHIMKRDSELARAAADSGWMSRLGLGRKKGR
jgi:PilZ domain